LRELATVDGLTRLPNRHAFQEYLAAALAATNTDESRLALLFVDLDRFKEINDSFGHHAGDTVLREMAARLAECTRDMDWVARLAGDEFMVIVPEVDSLETVRSIAQRIRKALTRAMTIEGVEVQLTCSIGIALCPDDAIDAERLFQNADAAMYQAKREGRNRYAFFRPELRERAILRLSRENALRQAIAADELELHYQPIVEATTGSLHGVEALVRWRHADGQLLAPAEFIPLAEETGLIWSLGEWVLNAALNQLAAWDSASRIRPLLSVNFSVAQCRQGKIRDVITRSLAHHHLSPDRLIVEVTEAEALLAYYQENFRPLREDGMQLAMDDFGVGASTLAQLRRLPVDMLKLDVGIVADIESCARDQAITRAIISMADALEITVVAEGVETPGQRRSLMDAGCRRMQGFLLGRPKPPGELERLLRLGIVEFGSEQ
jgi:diguanylate cyclase (GGDEF)-like protein